MRCSSACAVAVALLLASTASCSKFGSDETSVTSDGGAPVERVSHRKVTVAVDWPTVTLLDPREDIRRAKTEVTVTDATSSTRRIGNDFGVEKGPYALELESTNLVDVTITVKSSSGRVLAYGERRAWDLTAAGAVVTVAVRKRMLYVVTPERRGSSYDGIVSFLDMSEDAVGEPGISDKRDDMDGLQGNAAGWITHDGTWLVVAGGVPGAKGGLRVIKTADHEVAKDVKLAFALRDATPLFDGHQAVVTKGADESASYELAIVDLDSGASRPVAPLQGGRFETFGAATAPDGNLVAVVGQYTASASAPAKAKLVVYDGRTQEARTLDLPFEHASAVKFLPDGKSIVLGGWSDGTAVEGKVLQLSVETRTITATVAFAAKPAALVGHPDGHHVYVANEAIYSQSGPACCSEMRIVDLATQSVTYTGAAGNSGPEREVISGLVLPYAPGTVLGGASDNGNNVQGTVFDITTPGVAPAPLGTTDWGSASALLTPFGTPL